jgi:hypothetical protein
MSDDNNKIFAEHYHAFLEKSDRVSHSRVTGTVQLGSFSHQMLGPEIVNSERVIAVYLPESMFEKLVNDTCNKLREEEIRNNDYRAYKLFMEYKMFVELLR